MFKKNEKLNFLLRNLARGLLFFAILLSVFLLLNKQLDHEDVKWLDSINEKPGLVYLTYISSEVFFGIVPPEIYFLWSVDYGIFNSYILDIFLLATISFLAGVLGYMIGAYFNNTRLYLFLRKRISFKYEEHLTKYGGYLIVVAALTPIPFSAICMLVGSARYPLGKFLYMASSRFLRFAVLSYVVWISIK
ncbi:MAG: VTT domain-containing protein [Bacteroidota bacterium]